MSGEATTTEPWRQPRRSNNPTATVQCPACGAESGWRGRVSDGSPSRRDSRETSVHDQKGRSRLSDITQRDRWASWQRRTNRIMDGYDLARIYWKRDCERIFERGTPPSPNYLSVCVVWND